MKNFKNAAILIALIPFIPFALIVYWCGGFKQTGSGFGAAFGALVMGGFYSVILGTIFYIALFGALRFL